MTSGGRLYDGRLETFAGDGFEGASAPMTTLDGGIWTVETSV